MPRASLFGCVVFAVHTNDAFLTVCQVFCLFACDSFSCAALSPPATQRHGPVIVKKMISKPTNPVISVERWTDLTRPQLNLQKGKESTFSFPLVYLKAGQGNKILQIRETKCATRFYFLFTYAEERERLLQLAKSFL